MLAELAQQCQRAPGPADGSGGDGILGLAWTHLGTGDKVISTKLSLFHGVFTKTLQADFKRFLKYKTTFHLHPQRSLQKKRKV